MQHGPISFDPLALPAMGYTREWQERYQRLGRAARDYIERLRDYNGSFVGVAVRAQRENRRLLGKFFCALREACAALLCGGTFVPLNAKFPAGRLRLPCDRTTLRSWR